MEPKRLDDIHCKYLVFWLVDIKPKTAVWEVRSKSDNTLLGTIKWYPQWRQYCFEPESATVWSFDCIDDIKFFLAMANGNHADRKIGINCELVTKNLGL